MNPRVLTEQYYEVASMYTAGVSECVHVRDTYECIEITEDQVILSCCTQDEVIERFGKSNGDLAAKNFVQQLLRIVTKDQILDLILQHR